MATKKKTIKKWYPIPELLEQLLVTINMFEGSDEAHMGGLVAQLRNAHLYLKNEIGIHPDYQDNKGLAKLDRVYVEAGWDNNGLRWMTEKGCESEDIFIVEFDNDEKTKWHLA